MSKQKRPDSKLILAGLKDFQRDTVDYVFRRLYLDEDRVHRFLVADEVGLGKTLVARGLIAKAIDHLWNDERRIDIVYVCSNAEIARQNIARLNILGDKRCSFATRLTLLAITLKNLKKEKINFISFTPTTSFDMSSTGWSLERELLFHLLNNRIENGNFKKMTRFLSASAGLDQFRNRVTSFGERHPSPHPSIELFFNEALDEKTTLLPRFKELYESMPRAGVKVPDELNRERNMLIGELRKLLAKAGLKWLEPDLVILDEFQRFKDLLTEKGESNDSPSAELARELFQFREVESDPNTEARVLLLSATPYKMFTMSQERETDDHYADFQTTLKFLMPTKEHVDSVVASIKDYRESMWNIGNDGGAGVIAAKNALEAKLRAVMTRTERLASSVDRSGMLIETERMKAQLSKTDIEHYMALDALTATVESSELLSFWKSAPYLLNFMDDYDFKRRVFEQLESPTQDLEFVRAFNEAQSTLIDKVDVVKYAKLDPANAQLRGLQREVVDRGLWRLLWIPPSRPNYRPSGIFASQAAKDFTKTLVFSSWKVVPKVVASLLSYEAERSMFCSLRRSTENTAAARSRRRGLLRFDMGKSGPRGMPVFSLLYPSQYLARTFDPASYSSSEKASDIIRSISDSIEQVLKPHLDQAAQKAGEVDRAWYWAGLLLLDQIHYPEDLQRWIGQEALNERSEDTNVDGEGKGWHAHIELARQFVNGSLELGRPPQNLCRVLAAMAIAAPGICALRGFTRNALTSHSSLLNRQNASMHVGEAFIHLFNLQEVMAMIRGQKRERIARIAEKPIPYWESVLRYCVQGNIQAVLDEYLHVLCDSPGANMRIDDGGLEVSDPCETVAAEISNAMTFRTSSIKADTFRVTRRSVSIDEPIRFRTRFAMAFGDQRNEDDSEGSRKEHVRDAFNSPFWPFVLVSTSVGQEGLDFHRYCHSIMHWNLPANPVDLEQREGRIHRYKSHALRRNIAWKFGRSEYQHNEDIWTSIFDVALKGRDPKQNDLFPYWICDDGPAKIERHVPSLPLSREKKHQANLMRSLTVYRLVFGQNRQEDMIQFLLRNANSDLIEKIIKQCSIDLSPPNTKTTAVVPS